MEIKISSIKEFLYYKLNENKNIKVVAATSSGNDYKQIKNKLLLNYDDSLIGNNIFTDDHAKKIIKFVKKVKQNEILYCLCDAGQSRSAAVAASLMLEYNGNDMEIWENCKYYPNILIYKTMCKNLNINILEAEIQEKVKINQEALKNLIKNGRC